MVGVRISRADVVLFVRSRPRGVVTTIGPDGGPQAALVDFAATDAGELVFNSRRDARKVRNLLADPRVALVVGGQGDVCLQIEGVPDVLEGALRAEPARVYEARFPGSRALADGFSVIRVRPHWIRRYDASKNPPVVLESACSW